MQTNQLKTSAALINSKAKFSCSTDGKPEIIVDYIPPLGDGEGYTSLELLLLSLASCFASTIKFVLTGPMKKTITALKVEASGIRREEHPTSFKAIELIIELEAEVSDQELEQVIKRSEESLCPVYDMIEGNTEISVKFKIKCGG